MLERRDSDPTVSLEAPDLAGLFPELPLVGDPPGIRKPAKQEDQSSSFAGNQRGAQEVPGRAVSGRVARVGDRPLEATRDDQVLLGNSIHGTLTQK